MARLAFLIDILENSHDINKRQRRNLRREARYADNAFAMSDLEFKKNYRLSKETFEVLHDELESLLPRATRRSDITTSFGSFVLNQHPIKTHLINLLSSREQVYLLGDSGYPQREYLMTPIVNAPIGSPEEHYSKAHCVARNTVERTIGILKNRWRCLLGHRVLHYHPDTAAKIVNACCVLHNICNQDDIEDNVIPILIQQPDSNPLEMNQQEFPIAELARGIEARSHLVNNMWATRNLHVVM